jgi:demethylmenaquinone methyltransferase/2-methoxy-6-polyprenyl-1,4-benzoquinol methylase
VSLFDRFARYYELVMPPAAGGHLRRGLAVAERPVERVLDVGGGTGRAARALGAPERIVVDPARGMLRQAPRTLGRLQADATRLPLREDSVDAAVTVDALHHMPDHAAVASELFRVLRPGGVFVVRDFDPGTLPGRGLTLAERIVGFDSTFHDPDALGEVLMDAGFEPSVLDRGFEYTVVGFVPRE